VPGFNHLIEDYFAGIRLSIDYHNSERRAPHCMEQMAGRLGITKNQDIALQARLELGS